MRTVSVTSQEVALEMISCVCVRPSSSSFIKTVRLSWPTLSYQDSVIFGPKFPGIYLMQKLIWEFEMSRFSFRKKNNFFCLINPKWSENAGKFEDAKFGFRTIVLCDFLWYICIVQGCALQIDFLYRLLVFVFTLALLSLKLCHIDVFLSSFSLSCQLAKNGRVLESFADKQASSLTSLARQIQENSMQQVRVAG